MLKGGDSDWIGMDFTSCQVIFERCTGGTHWRGQTYTIHLSLTSSYGFIAEDMNHDVQHPTTAGKSRDQVAVFQAPDA